MNTLIKPTPTGGREGRHTPPQGTRRGTFSVTAWAIRYLAILGFAALCVYFSFASSVFATGNNVASLLSQSAMLAIVALAMTFVVRSGGIDLSVGIALDFGAMASITMISQGYVAWISVLAGLLAGVLVGAANGFFIAVLRVTPFLATLSTMFIGQSIQKVLTQGGSPNYLVTSTVPSDFLGIGRGAMAGIDVPVFIAVLALAAGWIILERLRAGRVLTATGVQPAVARIAGIPVRTVMASSYVLSSMTCALAGIVLGSRLGAYIPLSGDYYLLDSIGAVFIGTTLQKESLPNVPGTLLGVLIFGVLANGLNLVGLSFYWQGFARGVVLLLVLGLSVTLSKRRRRLPRPTAMPAS